MFAYLSNWLLGSCTRGPLVISDFREKRLCYSPIKTEECSVPCAIGGFMDTEDFDQDELYYIFGNHKPGSVLVEYYNSKNVRIAYIKYYITTGQIGLFFIEEEYQHRGLGKQILSKVIKELRANHCEEAWAVSTKHHTFWSNVNHKSFEFRYPAHPSVTGPGYFMKLPV